MFKKTETPQAAETERVRGRSRRKPGTGGETLRAEQQREAGGEKPRGNEPAGKETAGARPEKETAGTPAAAGTPERKTEAAAAGVSAEAEPSSPAPSQQPSSGPSRGMGRKAAIAAAAVLAVAAGAYIYIGTTYRSTFFNGTVINGMNVSGKTVDEVKSMIAEGVEGYVLVLEERGGRTESITGASIGLEAGFDGSLEALLEAQNPYAWLPAWIGGTEREIKALVSYDEGALDAAIEALDCLDETKTEKPQNARISQYEPGTGYTIVPETEGNEADEELLKTAVAAAVTSLQTSLSLDEAGVYTAPSVTAEDESLAALLEEYRRYAGVTVTYTFGDKTEVLNGETISQWLYDDGSQVIISDEAAAEYVQTLATKYNTAYRAKSLKTSYGPTVTISKGNYGWRINQAQEKTELLNVIRAGESVSREPVYSQKGASHGENDYGDTYVEINLTAQHLFFYKDGKLLVESDFVSGNTSRGWTTPPGAYPLTYKERNATLKGEGYRTPVSYWMPFNGGIGLHDASWRDAFGGTLYKTGGSHGCVNLPPSVAKVIYENISQGDPVLCYELAGTEQTVTTRADGTPVSTKPAETQPAETQPAETQPTETQPAETKPAESQPSQPAETQPTAPQPTQPAETRPTQPAETAPTAPAPEPSGPAGPGESAQGSGGESPAGPGAGL